MVMVLDDWAYEMHRTEEECEHNEERCAIIVIETLHYCFLLNLLEREQWNFSSILLTEYFQAVFEILN